MKLLLLARIVLEDAARERVFYIVVLYAFALGLLTPWVADLSLAAPTRAVQDLGLTLGWAVASATAIWLGIRTIGWDLRSRAAALVLSGPVSRRSWVGGRALGMLAVLALVVTSVTLVHALVSTVHGVGPTPDLLWFGLLLLAECAVLAGIAALLGAAVAPGVAAACAVALWAAGHLANEYTAATADVPLLARVVFGVVPDLDLFVVQTALVHGEPVDPVRAGLALLYGLLWTVGLLALTTLVVERTDAA